MAEARDPAELHSKHKAITALLPYAIWRDRDGEPQIFDKFLLAVKAWGGLKPWPYDHPFYSRLFSEASPRAIVLASPYRHGWHPSDRELVEQWDAAVSAVLYTEEVAQSVVDMLLQIATIYELIQYSVTKSVWSWLKKRPSLPPVSKGLRVGSGAYVVETVKGLNDTEIFKSYLLLLWSEWNPLQVDGFNKMCALVREDFGGVGMGHHRADLIQQLDHTLGQLDRGLEYLKQHNPNLNDYHILDMRDQYEKLKDILLEINIEAIARMSYSMVILLSILTEVNIYRIPCNIHVCTSSLMSIVSHSPQPYPPSLVHELCYLCLSITPLITLFNKIPSVPLVSAGKQ